MKLKRKGAIDAKHRCKLRVARRRLRLVETLSTEPGVPGESLAELSGGIAGKSQPVSIGVSDYHFSCPPWGVLRNLCNSNLFFTKLSIAVVYIRNLKVDSATDLAVSGMFR